jgi:hypothetical protein
MKEFKKLLIQKDLLTGVGLIDRKWAIARSESNKE